MKRYLLLIAATASVASGCYDASATLSSTGSLNAPRRVVPLIDASMKSRLRSVYLSGLSMGNRAAVFSKIGDSITATGSFLSDIGCSVESLGRHTGLAPTISYFRATTLPGRSSAWCGVSNSFNANSVAASLGWTTGSALASTSRSGCAAPYNTNLRCELRLTRPSIALIMLGTNDLERVNDLSVYRTNLTRIVTDSVNAGVIPVLSTIPPRLDSATYNARVAAYNDVLISVASTERVPLWDYWMAVTDPSMLNQGMSSDGVHPSVYQGQYGSDLTDTGLRYGYNQRNLTALQVLARVKAIVIDNGPPDVEGAPDTGTPDTGAPDSGAPDTGAPDTGAPDTGTPDTGTPDTGTPDTGTPDTGPDATADTGPDAGTTGRRVVPVINASMQSRLRSVYLSGLSMGNRAAVFSKVGDSITATGSFLSDIGCSTENLGSHTALAPTVSYFRATSLPSRASVWCGMSNSFSADSYAAAMGWTTGAVFSNVSVSGCAAPNNTALRCELRLTRPSIALIMLGTNDVDKINNLATYRTNLTRIVTEAIGLGVIPVLSTIPPRLDSATYNTRVTAHNDVVMSVASTERVPLWDYWVAMTGPSMLNQGMSSDGVHPSVYQGQYGSTFTDAALRYGYNQRNLTAIQVLAHVRAVVIDNGTPDP